MSTPTDVVDRLERLAAHAPGRTADPDALWARGRRRHVGRWTAVVVCSVVLAGLGAVAAAPVARLLDAPVATTRAGNGLVLPDTILPPDRGGQRFPRSAGVLSAVGLDEDTGAPWGVSGVTGELKFLDLPDTAVQGWEVALSDDGRHLAYWTSVGDAGADPVDDQLRWPTGVAVLDLTTGEEQQWNADAPYGVVRDGLLWVGDVLWIGSGAYDDADRNTFEPLVRTWTLGSEPAVVTTGRGWASSLRSATAAAGSVMVPFGSSARRVDVLDADGGVASIRLLHAGAISSPSMSPDGKWIVGIERSGSDAALSTPAPVRVGAVEAEKARMERLGGVEASSVLGWRSPTVAVVATPMDHNSNGVIDGVQASSFDVRNGAFRRMVYVVSTRPVAYAADAWSGDVVPATYPPFVLRPAWFATAAAALGLLLMFGWRARRRRRGHA